MADPGGGRLSLLCHDVGFLTLGPKLDPLLDPPFFACRPNLDPLPLSKILDPPLLVQVLNDLAPVACTRLAWLRIRDGSKSFFASPSQVTSHFLASPSQVTSHFRASPSQVTSHLVRRQVKSSHKSFGQTSSQVKSQVIWSDVKQVKSQVIWSKHKSSHKSLCPSTSQIAHYFLGKEIRKRRKKRKRREKLHTLNKF